MVKVVMIVTIIVGGTNNRQDLDIILYKNIVEYIDELIRTNDILTDSFITNINIIKKIINAKKKENINDIDLNKVVKMIWYIDESAVPKNVYNKLISRKSSFFRVSSIQDKEQSLEVLRNCPFINNETYKELLEYITTIYYMT
jgi:hypothetical protein